MVAACMIADVWLRHAKRCRKPEVQDEVVADVLHWLCIGRLGDPAITAVLLRLDGLLVTHHDHLTKLLGGYG